MKFINKLSGNRWEWSFSLGKPKYDIFHYAKITLLLKLPLEIAALLPGVDKKKLFFAIDSLQNKFNLEVINDFIIKDEELLGYRVEKVIDEAIKHHETAS